MKVTTRFAPSPTGNLHIGSVRTALFSWLYARRHQGNFLLRIEDTDRQRSTPEATQLIFDTLKWIGLESDASPVFQSTRMQNYHQRAHELVERGLAYHCVCSKERLGSLRKEQMQQKIKPRYDHRCRDLGLNPRSGESSVIRFKNPLNGTIEVEDMVQGLVTYSNSELDDLIIVRPDQSPTYNFAVVVDEMEMGITHVIRGDDHLNNTPRQINLFNAFEHPVPKFAHVPMILSSDGKKISKRENPPSLLSYRDAGYLPEAMMNYLVRLGWSHKDQELFSVDEMIRLFDPEKIHRSPAAIDTKKMEWINHQHMLRLGDCEISKRVEQVFADEQIQVSDDAPSIAEVYEVQKTRCKTLVEFVRLSRYFFEDFDDYDPDAEKKHLNSESIRILQAAQEDLSELDEWHKEVIHGVLKNIVERNEIKFGELAQPLRVALTGNTISPGIDITIELIGKRRVLQRLNRAIEKHSSVNQIDDNNQSLK